MENFNMNLHRLSIENLKHLVYYYDLVKEHELYNIYKSELDRRLALTQNNMGKVLKFERRKDDEVISSNKGDLK